MNKLFKICFVIINIFLCFSAYSLTLKKNVSELISKDTACKVWVIFLDKETHNVEFTEKAKKRRFSIGIKQPLYEDFPVSQKYIKDIESTGAKCVNYFKWANAASFKIASNRILTLTKKNYIKEILLVRTFLFKKNIQNPILDKKSLIKKNNTDIYSNLQLEILKVPAAHRYISSNFSKTPGDGILIGVFDSGFRLNHQCFSYLHSNNLVYADSDFVDHDNTVYDPDSVANNPSHPYYKNDEHGSGVLSIIAGYDPNRFMGIAYGAKFVLARTEDSPTELHIEEDNWAAAVVWAESLGVDVINSSLGYRTGYTFPDTDYTYRDLDGVTTIITKAAQQAARLGVLVVSSSGNEGPDAGSISAPSDGEDVIAVGAVDSYLQITPFSGRGPTFDNRIKPDCVAMGSLVFKADVYEKNILYTYGSGTSYSAPQIAGLCALIKQTNPQEKAQDIRNRLYSSCFFTPYQDTIDNNYGRGIPDALLACLPYNQTYITLSDSFEHSINNAKVMRGLTGNIVALSDSFGYAIIPLTGIFPETLWVIHDYYFPKQIFIESRHSGQNIKLSARYNLSIFLQDSLSGYSLNGNVLWKSYLDSAFSQLKTDSLGFLRLNAFTAPQIEIYAVVNGYFPSNPILINLTQEPVDTVIIKLMPRNASQFIIYPNVINIATKKQKLTMEFTASKDEPRQYSQLFTAVIRSIDGKMIWQYSTYLTELKPVVLKWPQKNQIVAPGVYYFFVNYAGKSYKKKFFVTG